MPPTPPDLPTALRSIEHVLGEIDRGAGFCEDRGFGWTIENERRAGIDDVRALFDTRPELSILLPDLARLLADRSRVVGLQTIPFDELKGAIRKVERDARNGDER